LLETVVAKFDIPWPEQDEQSAATAGFPAVSDALTRFVSSSPAIAVEMS
jgi:hypothetical protein